MTKGELRKIYLEKLRSLSAEERAEKSERISNAIFRTVNFESIKTLHCFISIEKFNEVETESIFRRLWTEFPQIIAVVPKVDLTTGEMRHLKFTPTTELVKNAWEIFEPEHNEFVETGEIDIVLVPLLCFDRKFHRVGFGKGFYDRFLTKCRSDCQKIGLSFFPPVENIDDVHDGDVTLDMCITPTEIYRR